MEMALACDICEEWEHVSCLRGPDKLDEALYTAVNNCRSKAILFVCTKCRKKGSLSKRLYKLEIDNARGEEQRARGVRGERPTPPNRSCRVCSRK